jgi:hypothetical protein
MVMCIQMSSKRIYKELGTNYCVIKYDKLRGGLYVPKIIRYFQTKDNYIDLNVSEYPFQRPFIVDSNFVHFSHEGYAIMQRNGNSFFNYRTAYNNGFDNYETEFHNNYCFHCRSIFSCHSVWSPSYSFHSIFRQVRLLNSFISSAVKLEVFKRNYIRIPEDVIHYIITFLSIPIDEIFEIKIEHGARFKCVY